MISCCSVVRQWTYMNLWSY